MLTFPDVGVEFCTLEHSYATDKDSWAPKVEKGTYECQRATMKTKGLETFIIMNVPNAEGIFFHKGNYNDDSEGCVLLGTDCDVERVVPLLIDSRVAFDKFMSILKNDNQFTLVVS